MNLNDTLRIVSNPNCKTGCNKAERDEITENDLCTEAVSVIDHLPIRCVGDWAVQKIFLLVQYFGIFAKAMKDKWPGKLNYIEICSGPGRCINRKLGDEFNGTALSIIEHPAYQYIKTSLFFDSDERVVNALNQRIKDREIKNAFAFTGNYQDETDICRKINQVIVPNSLNLVFIDPTDCSVPFRLIRFIKRILPNTDFIINLASMTDFNRNIGNVLRNPEQYCRSLQKYSLFLDGDRFFYDDHNITLANHGKYQELRDNFRESYLQNLRGLGYVHFDFKRIDHLYDILFAAVHPRALEFWKKATSREYNGQRNLL